MQLTDESITRIASTAISDNKNANPTPDRTVGAEGFRNLEPPPSPDILSLQLLKFSSEWSITQVVNLYGLNFPPVS